jgi:hypothetical protein
MLKRKGLWVLLALVGVVAAVWAYGARGPTEQQIIDGVELGVSLETFLESHAWMGSRYDLYAYSSERVRYDTNYEVNAVPGASQVDVIDTSSLAGLLQLVRSGKVDGSKFTGALSIGRIRLFSGGWYARLDFVDGKLSHKELFQPFDY